MYPARYEVTGFDDSASGYERLRDRDEFILIASANGETDVSDLASQWRDDLQSCARPDGFDFAAARAAVDSYVADNAAALARTLAALETPARDEEGDVYMDDEEAATLRLYVTDSAAE